MSKCPKNLDHYTSWMVISQGHQWIVVRDSFCYPFGPRVTAEKDGRFLLFEDHVAAFELAHRLNSELYSDDGWRPRTEHNWINTLGGRRFWPLDPRPEEVFVADIAAGIARKSRFGGFTHRGNYSVAEHSVMVSRLLRLHPKRPELAKWGLLHDAAEAYFGDICRPVKREFGIFGPIEERILKCVAERFGLAWPIPDEVWHADDCLLGIEAEQLVDRHPEWNREAPPYPGDPPTLRCWGADYARDIYLREIEFLFPEHKET